MLLYSGRWLSNGEIDIKREKKPRSEWCFFASLSFLFELYIDIDNSFIDLPENMDNIAVKLQRNAQRYVENCTAGGEKRKSFSFSSTTTIFSFDLGFRTKLPVPMFDRSQISIWSILKQCIGKVSKRTEGCSTKEKKRKWSLSFTSSNDVRWFLSKENNE